MGGRKEEENKERDNKEEKEWEAERNGNQEGRDD